jgi:hypothetical protein
MTMTAWLNLHPFRLTHLDEAHLLPVFVRSGPRAVGTLMQTCHYFYIIGCNETIWKIFCNAYHIPIFYLSERLFYDNFKTSICMQNFSLIRFLVFRKEIPTRIPFVFLSKYENLLCIQYIVHSVFEIYDRQQGRLITHLVPPSSSCKGYSNATSFAASEFFYVIGYQSGLLAFWYRNSSASFNIVSHFLQMPPNVQSIEASGRFCTLFYPHQKVLYFYHPQNGDLLGLTDIDRCKKTAKGSLTILTKNQKVIEIAENLKLTGVYKYDVPVCDYAFNDEQTELAIIVEGDKTRKSKKNSYFELYDLTKNTVEQYVTHMFIFPEVKDLSYESGSWWLTCSDGCFYKLDTRQSNAISAVQSGPEASAPYSLITKSDEIKIKGHVRIDKFILTYTESYIFSIQETNKSLLVKNISNSHVIGHQPMEQDEQES